MKVALTVITLVLSCHCCFVSSAGMLRIELFNGKQKCIGQDFDEGDLAVFNIGAYSSAGESVLDVTVRE